MKINLKALEVGIVKNVCDQSCYGTLKLTVSGTLKLAVSSIMVF